MSNIFSSVILYRDDPNGLAPNTEELGAMKKYFPSTSSRTSTKIGEETLVIPRYSYLPFGKELERDLKNRGAKLINTYQEHRYIADLQNWYDDFKDITPRTWFRLEDAPREGFRFILKGETNSKKFNWNTHMFAENFSDAVSTHSRLLDDSLISYQKIYIREYIPLETFGYSLSFGLPITKEYRSFIYGGKVLSTGFYWSSHIEDIKEWGYTVSEQPDKEGQKLIDLIAERLREKVPFVVADIAKTKEGKWILIELNDGTMSGLSENNPDTLYKNLLKELDGDDEEC